ncbi:MAG: CDP-alcohol phosphatidyltransferase family protein [Candidatus Babeliales bacterium]
MKIRAYIPLILSAIRFFVAPFVVPFLYIYAVDANSSIGLCSVAIIYLVLLSTDFFDGYLARRWHSKTVIGAVLDSIADKMFLFSLLVAFVYMHTITPLLALLFIFRECLVTAWRLMLLQLGHPVPPVLWSAKIKTVLQGLFIVLTIAASIEGVPSIITYSQHFFGLCALFSSGYSAYEYGSYSWRLLRKELLV